MHVGHVRVRYTTQCDVISLLVRYGALGQIFAMESYIAIHTGIVRLPGLNVDLSL